MSIRTKLHGKTTIHEYDHEFTNDEASIRLFVKTRGRHCGFDTPFANLAQGYSTTEIKMNLSSFLLSLFSFVYFVCFVVKK